ncbi:unnamed protein product [Medioppia subpectinata]|uniref:Transcription initiation factor TFIID subunit 9 n=1 Tax=Medioppia subpectinata TaxID=1979941 RepID=A0A7R9Q7N1_9ACAR|nr:unnamed protein product [Medioppia subpectinata]CAG2116013.1 unnamed protein product [Medioppia subpectinata]
MEKGGANTSKKMTKSEAKTASTATLATAPAISGGSLANKTTPKDIQIVTQILKDMAITDYEPRVVNQMVEFTYRYVSNVLEDAHLFSSYAKKKAIDCDDISLSVQLQVDKGFTGPPPRDLLLEIARTKNNQTLPAIKSHNGPRLPADRYSLIACNYRQKSNKSKPASTPTTFRSSMTGTSLLNSNAGLKPMSSTPKTGSQTVTIKPMDGSQGMKRKLDDS